jgi:ABC-type glycerol-3-phosphate transport system permease component
MDPLPSHSASSGRSARFRQKIAGKILSYIILGITLFCVAYPFLVLLYGSLKSEGDFLANPLSVPRVPHFDNYLYAWNAAHIPKYTVNSAIVASATVLLTLTLAATASYGLSQFRFRGGRLIYLSFILLLTIPVQIYIIPLYIIVVKLRLADNYLGLILPYTAGSLPLAVFLFRTYFDALPTELVDAARIDGCNHLRAFMHVMLPLARPMIATVSIFTFVGAWNEFFLALVFIHDPNMATLPLGLQAFFVNQYQTQFPQLFATLIVSIGPIVVVYLLLQRHFMAGLTAGAVRG